MLDFHVHRVDHVRPGMPSRLPRLLIRVHSANTPVVTLAGEIDATTLPQLKQCLKPLRGQVMVDLRSVTFVDLCGLEFLAATRRKLRDSDGDLRLRSPQDGVRRALHITGLDGVVIGG